MKEQSLISNYYDVLNVKPTASVAEINKKFKQKAKENHPDKNKDTKSNIKMKEVNEARKILTDEKLRKIFDQKLFIYSLQNANNNVAIFLLTNKIENLNINEKDHIGNTPLHYACFYNFLETVILLIKYGANINASNNNDNTPLHYSLIGNADLALINFLVEKGANVKAKDNTGKDSLYFMKNFATDKKFSNLLLKKSEELKIKENQKKLLKITKKRDNLEKKINDIKINIANCENKKINSILNFIIVIITFGCLNKNKYIKDEILIKTDQLNKLISEKRIINDQKKLLEKEIRKNNFNNTSVINAMPLKNQQSTVGLKHGF